MGICSGEWGGFGYRSSGSLLWWGRGEAWVRANSLIGDGCGCKAKDRCLPTDVVPARTPVFSSFCHGDERGSGIGLFVVCMLGAELLAEGGRYFESCEDGL